MVALTLPVCLGLIAGLVAGGHPFRLSTTTFKYGVHACAALAVQLVIFNPPLERIDGVMKFGPAVYVLSMLVVMVVLLQNARAQTSRVRGQVLWIAAVGVLLNCLVVTANGGYMPRAAIGDWPQVPTPSDAGRLVNVAPMQGDTRLGFLGDVLAEPRWIPTANILSIGDVMLALGLGGWAFCLTEPRGMWRRRLDPREVEMVCPAGSSST